MLVMNKIPRKKFSTYQHVECLTGDGQRLEITCSLDDVDKVKEALLLVKDVSIPRGYESSIPHGAYEGKSRYKIEQHDYAASMRGFIESLEIKNPPDNRCGFVVYQFFPKNHFFWEFESLEALRKGYKAFFKQGQEEFEKVDGLIRNVEVGTFTPWFYAVGDEDLMGDFVFPHVFGDHPVYRVGEKYVVREEWGHKDSIKTCMGAVEFEVEGYPYFKPKSEKTRIYWKDGSVWEGSVKTGEDYPKLLEDDIEWVQEAVLRFKELLKGTVDRFEIPFLTGGKFTGRFTNKARNPKGTYYVKVRVKGKDKKAKEKIKEGEIEFKPTAAVPTVASELDRQAKNAGGKVIKIIKCRRVRDYSDPKWIWEGVYFRNE